MIGSSTARTVAATEWTGHTHHAPLSTKSPLNTNFVLAEGLPTTSSLQATRIAVPSIAFKMSPQQALCTGTSTLALAIAPSHHGHQPSPPGCHHPQHARLTFCRRRGTVRVCRLPPPRAHRRPRVASPAQRRTEGDGRMQVGRVRRTQRFPAVGLRGVPPLRPELCWGRGATPSWKPIRKPPTSPAAATDGAQQCGPGGSAVADLLGAGASLWRTWRSVGSACSSRWQRSSSWTQTSKGSSFCRSLGGRRVAASSEVATPATHAGVMASGSCKAWTIGWVPARLPSNQQKFEVRSDDCERK